MTRVFEELLKKRGITDSFLNPRYQLGLAKGLPDIDKAILRIESAIKNKENVLVYGDYDVDGVTASTLMHDCLKMAGIGNVFVMLPDRFIDGYGMSNRCLDRAKELGTTLVITVDCGSNNAEVISKLKRDQIDVIVTDHHELMGDVPKDAIATVNPKRLKKGNKLRELCGCGVAFLVMQKLVENKYILEGQEKWLLDLVVIGTLCDSMEINEINRMLCYFGMKVLKKTRRRGLIELLKIAKVNKINSEAIGFQIGPRLNAGGRMESAEISLKLLMADKYVETIFFAEKLDQLNYKRREQQRKATEEITETNDSVIVVSGKWHEGILGIIAGRLLQKYHKPAFVLTELEGGILKGSGRSFGDFNLAEALKVCKESIVGGGGHAAACGVKLKKEKFAEFVKTINRYYDDLKLEDQEKYLEPDAEVELTTLEDLSIELFDDIRQLEPFGIGNMEPIFLLKDIRVKAVNRMGKEEEHVGIIVVDKNGQEFKTVAFNAPESWLKLKSGECRDIWINLVENEWQNVRRVEGRILQIK